MKRSLLCLLIVLIAACFTACGEDDATGPDYSLEPTLATVSSNIFERSCDGPGCHFGGEDPAPLDLTNDAGLRARLLGPAEVVPTMNHIVPGQPNESFLLLKVRGTQPDSGPDNLQMPLFEDQISADALDYLTEWISLGAP